MQEQKNNLYIPGAIILAGFLIAIGIYMSGDKKDITNNDNNVKKTEITLKTIDKEDNLLGNENASIKIVEFSDTECPFCKRFHTTMHNIVDSYNGNVAWVYRHFPLDSLHQKSRKEAEAVECANELGGNSAFWSVLDSIYTNTTSNDGLDAKKLPEFAKTAGIDETKFNECLSSGKMAKNVESEYQDGLKAGVNGTPHTMFVLDKAINNDKVVEINKFVADNKIYDREGNPLIKVTNKNKLVDVNGALPLEMMKTILDIVLK